MMQRRARRFLGMGCAFPGLLVAACAGQTSLSATIEAAGSAGAGAPAVTPGVAAGRPERAGAGVAAPARVAAAGSSGAVAAGSGAQAAGSGDSAAGSGAAAAAGGNAATAHAHDHCADGYLPEATDATMQDGPAEFYPPGNMDPSIVDLTVQPQVLKWMTDHLWQAAHVEWHAIRGCNLGGGRGLSKVDICKHTELVPKDQNCQTGGDGYQFLVFHRHMIQALKQLWPQHTEQFTGFAKFPSSAADVPAQWRAAWKDWDAEILEAAKIGDEIDKPENLARFPDEGVLGFWLQCNVGQKLASPPNDMPFVGLHFVLHAKWARPGNTKHGVNNTDSNIDNYMFWKLHGWIDNVWEKYRVAKGLQPTAAKLQADLTAQCREMDAEIAIIQSTMKPDQSVGGKADLPKETGFFHEQVRPIFASQTNLCSGCHAETGANAMLTLGGDVSSAKVVAGLVDQASRDGGQFKLVVPGDPDRSWLYLKASGKAAAAGCMPSSAAQCITGPMPPSSSGKPTLTDAELDTLRKWIQDGAKGPV